MDESLGLRDPVQLLEQDLTGSQESLQPAIISRSNMKSEQEDSSRYQKSSDRSRYQNNSDRLMHNDNSNMDEATINDILGQMGMQEASPQGKTPMEPGTPDHLGNTHISIDINDSMQLEA